MNLRIVTLTELRQHCNALAADDTLLTQYGLAAEAYIIRYTRRSTEELQAMSEEPNTYPLEIKQAVLMLAAHLYRVREAVSSINQVQVPFGFNVLVRPFRKFDANWRETEEEEETTNTSEE